MSKPPRHWKMVFIEMSSHCPSLKFALMAPLLGGQLAEASESTERIKVSPVKGILEEAEDLPNLLPFATWQREFFNQTSFV
jgi:hypothetical protein